MAFLAVSGSGLGLKLTTRSLRQNSSWTSISTSISLPCINPQALIRTAEKDESLVGPAFGQNKISRHLLQEVIYPLQLALIEWERKARKALESN